MKPPAKSPSKTRSGAAPRSINQLRIIGGQWRGRKLSFPDRDGLRPTGDRIRETLFNWLAPIMAESRCLDLFAGSGALGLEALSRGAATSVLVERDSLAAAQLRTNLALLQADQGQLVQADVLTWLSRGNSGAPFNIVFVDPPFQLNLWQSVIDALEAGNWLADDAAVYIESGQSTSFSVPRHWHLHRDKQAGQVSYRLFYREVGGSSSIDSH